MGAAHYYRKGEPHRKGGAQSYGPKSATGGYGRLAAGVTGDKSGGPDGYFGRTNEECGNQVG